MEYLKSLDIVGWTIVGAMLALPIIMPIMAIISDKIQEKIEERKINKKFNRAEMHERFAKWQTY